MSRFLINLYVKFTFNQNKSYFPSTRFPSLQKKILKRRQSIFYTIYLTLKCILHLLLFLPPLS